MKKATAHIELHRHNLLHLKKPHMFDSVGKIAAIMGGSIVGIFGGEYWVHFLGNVGMFQIVIKVGIFIATAIGGGILGKIGGDLYSTGKAFFKAKYIVWKGKRKGRKKTNGKHERSGIN